MGPNRTDLIIQLSPPEQWTRAKDKGELLSKIDAELSKQLGLSYEFSQPIEMRMNELIAGVRSDLAIKIFQRGGRSTALLGKRRDRRIGFKHGSDTRSAAGPV